MSWCRYPFSSLVKVIVVEIECTVVGTEKPPLNGCHHHHAIKYGVRSRNVCRCVIRDLLIPTRRWKPRDAQLDADIRNLLVISETIKRQVDRAGLVIFHNQRISIGRKVRIPEHLQSVTIGVVPTLTCSVSYSQLPMSKVVCH